MKKSTYLIGLALGASTLTFAQVGIGTSTPSSPLDIEATDAAIDINNTAADGDPALNFQLSGTTTFSIGIDDGDSDKLKIGTTAPDASTSVTIDGSGNVGIGTTFPLYPLEVQRSTDGVVARFYGNIGDFQMTENGGTSYLWNSETDLQFGTNTSHDLKIATNNLTRIYVEAGGNVGINTATPTDLLDVDGSVSFDGAAVFNDASNSVDFRVESNNKTHMLYVDGTNNEVGIGTSSPGATLEVNKSTDGVISRLQGSVGRLDYSEFSAINYLQNSSANLVFGTSSAHTLQLQTNNSTRMLITSAGLVGIGMTPSTNILEVGGTASKTTSGDWLANSDARLKKEIKQMDSQTVLDKMLALKGVTYYWNDTVTGSKRPTQLQYGFTAQNIQEVFPILVEEDNLGYLQTAYGTYDAMYVESMRALQQQIDSQQVIIEAQKKEIASEKAENESQQEEIKAQKQEIETIKAEASSSSVETNQKLKETTKKLAALEAKLNALLLLNSQGAVLTAEN